MQREQFWVPLALVTLAATGALADAATVEQRALRVTMRGAALTGDGQVIPFLLDVRGTVNVASEPLASTAQLWGDIAAVVTINGTVWPVSVQATGVGVEGGSDVEETGVWTLTLLGHAFTTSRIEAWHAVASMEATLVVAGPGLTVEGFGRTPVAAADGWLRLESCSGCVDGTYDFSTAGNGKFA